MRKGWKRKCLLFTLSLGLVLGWLTACGTGGRQSGQEMSSSDARETIREQKAYDSEQKGSTYKKKETARSFQKETMDQSETLDGQEEEAEMENVQEPDEKHVSVSIIESENQDIQLTIQAEEECYDEEKAESEVRLSCIYAEKLTVDRTDNAAVTSVLNENIGNLESDHRESGWELAHKAKEDRCYLSEDELAYWSPYSISERYRVERVDRQVLSLVREYSQYDQINHSYGYCFTENYNMDTGERIFLQDICTDMERLYDMVGEALQDVKNESNEEVSAQDSLQEDTWYFSEEGFHIICNLGTRLEDTKEVCIGYDRLGDILKTKYLISK